MARDKNNNSLDNAQPTGARERQAAASDSRKDKDAEKAKKAAARKKAQAKPAEKGPGFFERARQFFREVRIELKKVTWPTRKETLASTSVILVLVILVSFFLGVVDIILSRALGLLLG